MTTGARRVLIAGAAYLAACFLYILASRVRGASAF